MPSLKDFRNRIASVKSTRKITSAMKMVAASKLKRAQGQAEASQPYAERMAAMLSRLVANTQINASSPVLLAGTGKEDTHLLIVVTSDRGLCGGFNSFVARMARQKIRELESAGKTVKIICAGRKGRDFLRREFGDRIVKSFEGKGGKNKLSFAEADAIAQLALDMLAKGEFDVCTVVYNRFKSVMTQIPSAMQLIPFEKPKLAVVTDEPSGSKGLYEFEPTEETLLETLLPRNFAVQIFRTLLDSAAGEQAARMTAMDNATRNAGDMLNKLTLRYNRARQAYITKELIEIISGAEAV